MVDLPKREDWEVLLAQRVAGMFGTIRRELLDLLGDPPVYENISPEVWAALQRRLEGAILPVLVEVYEAQVGALAESVGYSFDMDVINTAAQGWARSYTFELVRGITDTTKRNLQTIVSNFYERGVTMGDTRAEIAKLFGPVRADMIAQTEVTRASTQGELAGARALNAAGVVTVSIHQTNADDRVCPICGPRDGVVIEDGRYPPLHVGCRCWVTTEVRGPAGEVL